jgi:hypothetical protein
MNINYEDFNWNEYINLNKDLHIMNTKDEAWKHWINHGQIEERPLTLINNTFIHHGRFGNLFFINMALHFLSLKFNLNCHYKYYNKFKKLGIYLHKGSKTYDNNITLTDDNFIDIIKNNDTTKSNIIINNESWFQTKTFANYLKNYFNISFNKNKIIENNIYKNRYNNNNDLFIHVRLGDIENRIDNINKYYENTLSEIKFNIGYISSDNISHSLCQSLIEKYKLFVVENDEIETIMFATTCNNIVLSGGTFSWLIGFLAFFSKNIFYPNLKNCWYGDIFQFTCWNCIHFN